MAKKYPFQVADVVYYKDDPDKNPYLVFFIYSPKSVGLTLKDYPDTEQDNQTNFSEIAKFKGKELVKAKKILKELMA